MTIFAEESTNPEKSQPPTVTCSSCNCTSPLVTYFRKRHNNYLCPRCLNEQNGRNLTRQLWLLLVVALLISVGDSMNAGQVQLRALVAFGMFFVILWLTVILHEGVHGLTAWLLGGRVFELALGVGEMRRCVWWRGTRFALRRHLFMGITLGAFSQRSWLRLRWLLYILAPITLHALAVALLLINPSMLSGTQYPLRMLLIIINGTQVVVNLFPWKFNAILATDGYRLWEISTGRKSLDELHEIYFLGLGFYALERKAYTEMTEAAEAGLAIYPESEQLKNLYAASLFVQDRFDEALTLFEQFLAESGDPSPSPVRGLLLSNRAGAALFQHLLTDTTDQAFLASAHDSAKEAYALLPWLVPVETVMALSILFQGRAQEALERLQKIMPRQEKDTTRAGVLVLMALAQQHLEQPDAARLLLAQAKQLDPSESRITARVEALIEGKSTPEIQRVQ